MRHLVFAFGCAATSAAAEVPQVAVDIAPVHSIVAAVMGDLGSPALIVRGTVPEQCGHGYMDGPATGPMVVASDR
jgi:zinc transport system substrate-binding protein